MFCPFGPTTGGFCMAFRTATLIFLTPDFILGATNPGSGSWKALAPLGAKKGDPKTVILWRDWSPTRFPQIFCEGNGLYGTQEPSGCTNFPPIPPRGRFYKDFPQTRRSPGPPGPLGGLPIVLFCGPVAYCRGRWHGRRPFMRPQNLRPNVRGLTSCAHGPATRSQEQEPGTIGARDSDQGPSKDRPGQGVPRIA